MTPPVRVQGTEQALLNNHIPYPLKTADCPFLLNKKHRVMLIGRIIHRHDQIPLLAGNPFMAAAILMQHHPGKGARLPPLTMSSPLGRSWKPTLSIEACSSPMCNCACLHLADTICKNASHSNPDTFSYTAPQPPSPHPPAHDEMRPASAACPTNPPSRLPRTDQCTDETSDHIPPKSAPLLPGSTDSHSIPNKPLQIASSGSPVASLSVSSVTSIGDHNKPDRSCATNRTYHLLATPPS